jgi:hypothetical protein
MDASLIEWLDRCYGITGVFPLHPGIRKDLSYSATKGVPKCKHGWATHVGVRHEWASTRRQLAGMAPGVRAPGAPGHRWKCKLGHKCPEIRETTAREDYRMFPPLPHAGLNRLHARRVALSRYRNVLESCWGSTQHRGVGADWPSRIRIGGDDTARWAISLALLRATSARLAHANGEYERLLQRSVDIGLIKKCGAYPVPVEAHKARTPEQQDLLEHDVNASPDAIPPDTWGNPVTLPIDEPYRLPDLTEFSDIPDRVAA